MTIATEFTPLAKESLKKNADGVPHGPSASSVQSPRQQKDKATSLHITFNLITCGLGTGVFTLPWSTAGASMLPALLIVVLVLVLNAWTVSILVDAAERHQTFDLGGLLARLPGRLGQAAQIVCNTVLWITMFLLLIGYVIVMVDCVQSLRSDALSRGSHHTLRSVIVALAAASVLPLCFLDQRRLAFTSIVAVVANANIFCFMVATYTAEEVNGSRPPVCFFGLAPGSVAMVSNMMQVVVVQMCVLPMYAELEDRSPAKFNKIVFASFGVLLVLCVGFAIAGYATFGQNVSSNVLRNFPATHWGNISRLAAVAAVSGVFPVILNCMIAPLSSSEALAGLRASNPKATAGFATCSIVFAVMVATLFIEDLGFLNVINGAISLGTFVAVVPSLIGLYLLGPRSNNQSWRGAMYALLAIGLAMSALGVVMSDNFAPALQSACVWPHLSP